MHDKAISISSIIFGATVCLVSAQDAEVSVDMVGIGSMSCTHWRSTKEHLLEGTVWIYGFWTGLNYVAAASGQTQPRISVSSIVAEVEKACATNIPDFSQRRMDHVSWGHEIGTTPIVQLVRCVRKVSQAFSASAIL